jgi:hypothetical protein
LLFARAADRARPRPNLQNPQVVEFSREDYRKAKMSKLRKLRQSKLLKLWGDGYDKEEYAASI